MTMQRTYAFDLYIEYKVSSNAEYKAALKELSEDDEFQGKTLYLIPYSGDIVLHCGECSLPREPIACCTVSEDAEQMEHELSDACSTYSELVCNEFAEDLSPEQWNILGLAD